MKYHLLYSASLGDLKSALITADAVAEDRNDEEKAQIECIKSFLELLADAYAKDSDGKFAIDARGESKHDGGSIELSFTFRKVVLPHQNALDGSKSAFPPTPEEKKRKEERIASTTEPGGKSPLPGAPEPLVGGVTTKTS